MTRTFSGSQLWRALHGSTALVVSLAGLAAASYPFVARADTPVLPQGGTVVVGAATIKSNIPGSLDVTTATDRTAINWQSFSIGAGNTVTINQPNSSSLTLNQVIGADPSSIFGSLKSNGQVVLANPNGIWFGPGSHVDVASIVASTATASQAALQAFAKGGALMLDKTGKADASIVNDGSISLGAEGLAGLVAPGVANNGIIAARLGRVVLASGTVATLDFYGDGLISFAVGGSVTAHAKDQAGKNLAAAVVNSGTITNAGGTVLMTAAAAKTVVDNTINMSGVVVASAINAKGGEIDLDGGSGTTNVSGELLASSKTASGGTINVTGHSVVVAPTARLDVTGAAGGSVAIGGGMHGAGNLAHATDVTLAQGSTITADGTAGAGGSVAVWSDGVTKAGATITATGTTVGGAVETSGHYLDIAGVSVKAGSWLLDPISVELTTADQGSIASALAGNTSVTITTSSSGSPGGGFGTVNANDTAGDIIVDAAGGSAPNGIAWSTTASLTLNAYGAVILASGAKIQDSAAGFIGLYSRGGVSIASGAIVSNVGASIYTSGNAQSVYAGTVSGGFVSLSDSGALTVAGTGVLTGTSNGLYMETGTFTAQSGAALSTVGVMELFGTTAFTVQNGATLSTTNGYIQVFGGAIDIGGTLNTSYTQMYGPSVQLDSTASISTTSGAYFSVTGSFAVPTSATALVIAPSLEIDYGGGPIGIGTTVSGTGALNLATGNLTALGFGSGTGTTAVNIRDTATGAGIATGGTLAFPGALTLYANSGELDIGGAISFVGAANISGSYAGAGISLTGSLTGTGSSYISFSANGPVTMDPGATISLASGYATFYNSNSAAGPGTTIGGSINAAYISITDSYAASVTSGAALVASGNSGITVSAPTSIVIQSGASLTAAAGGIYDGYYYSGHGAVDIGGTLAASAVSFYGSTIAIDATASISTNSAYFSASSGYVLPSGSVAVLTAPSLELDYSGGSVGLGVTASGGQALTLSSSNISALGIGTVSGTKAFIITDTNSLTGSGDISVAGGYSFPGILSLTSQYGNLNIGGTLSLTGYGRLAAGGVTTILGSVTDLGTGSSAGTLNISGLTSLPSGVSLTDAGGLINLDAGSNSIAMAIAGTISGNTVSIGDNFGIALAGTASVAANSYVYLYGSGGSITIANGAQVSATTGYVSIGASSSNAAVVIAGTVGASAITAYGSSIEIDSTAAITATYQAHFSASSAYVLPSGTAVNVSAPSLELDYHGGPIGLGTTVAGTGGLTLSSSVLAALGVAVDGGTSVSGTSLFYVYDTLSGAEFDIAGPLSFPGATSLSVTNGLMAISGTVNVNGSGFFGGYYYADSSSVSLSGALANIGTSGTITIEGSLILPQTASITNTTGSVQIYGASSSSTGSIAGDIAGTTIGITEQGGIVLAATASLTAATGTISASSTYGTVDWGGSASSSYFYAYGSTIQIDSTASIRATTASLSASAAYVLPTGSTANLVAPILSINYSGGEMGIETTATAGVPLSLTAAELGALGINLNGGTSSSGTSLLTFYDGYSSTSATMTVASGLVFPGAVSLSAASGVLVIAGGLTLNGSASLYGYRGTTVAGSIQDVGTGSTAGSLYIQGLTSLASGLSITNAGGYVSLNSGYNSTPLSIAGSVAGGSIGIVDSYGVTIASGASISASNGSIYIAAASGVADIAGSLTATSSTSFYQSVAAIYGSTVEIEATASITAPAVLLSASSAFILPTGSSVNVTAPSLEIDYSGGPIGIGINASGTNPLNITIAELRDSLGVDLTGGTSESGTSLLTILNNTYNYNTPSQDNVSLASGLIFPGGLSLATSYYGSIDIAGSLTLHGAGTISADNYYSSAGITLGGSIIDTGPSGGLSIYGLTSVAAGLSITNSGGYVSLNAGSYNSIAMAIAGEISGTNVYLYDPYGISIAANAAILATGGTVSAGSYYDPLSLAGSINAAYVSLNASEIDIAATAAITAATSVSLSATTAYVLPSGTNQVITTPSLYLFYEGGPVGIGGAAVSGTGALNLDDATLRAIGAETASGVFFVYDYATNAGISIVGPLSFAGELSLESYYSGYQPIHVSGSLTAAGFATYSGLLLTGDTVIDTSGGALGLYVSGSINGAYNLTLNSGAGNYLALGGAIGNTAAPTGLTVIGYDYSYLPAITAAGNVSITSGNTIYLSSTAPITATGGGSVTLVGDTLGTGATGVYVTGTGALVNTTGQVSVSYDPGNYGAPLTLASFSPNAASLSLTMLVDSTSDLARIGYSSTALAQHYLLQKNLSFSGSYSSTSIGNSSTPFTGIFDGAGHTISGLQITYGSGYYIGLFGEIGASGVVSNLGVVNANILGNVNVGIFAGANLGTITNSYVTGTVSASVDASYMIGGFVGANSGIITGSYSTANVNGPTDSYKIGGFVGYSTGTIANSYATGIVTVASGAIALGGFVGNIGGGVISDSFSDGSVVALGDSSVGGFAGENFGATLLNVYSFTSVATGSGSTIGGLVGNNAGSIIDSYAAGNISIAAGASGVGGLTGASSVAASNSYWDTETTGVTSADPSGATGLNTAQLTTGTLPAGFSSSDWVATADSLPYLVWQGAALPTPIASGNEIVSGNVYTGYNGSGVSGAGVNIIVDGVAVGSTTSSTGGAFSIQFSSALIPSAAGNHEIIGYLSGTGFVGLTAYDTVALPYTGLPIYENEVVLQTTDSDLSSAVSALSSALTSAGASVGNTLTISSGAIATVNNLGMMLFLSAPSVSIDDTINVGTGTLLLSTTGTSVSQTAGLTAGVLQVNGTSGQFSLQSAANSVGSLTLGPLSSSIVSIALTDSQPLEIDSIATGSASFGAPSVTFGAGALISAGSAYFQTDSLASLTGASLSSSYVRVDTYVTGGSIGLGTATGTLQLTQDLINFLDIGSNFVIGDGSATIVTAGAVSLPGNPELFGNTVTLGGSLTAGYSLSVDATYATVNGTVSGAGYYGTTFSIAPGGSLTESAGASIASGYIYVNSQTSTGMTITIDGSLISTSTIRLQTGSGGSLTLGSGAVLSSSNYVALYADTLNVPANASDLSLTASAIYLDSGSGGNPSTIFVGTATGSGLNLSAATLGVFGTTIPVYVGNTSYTALSVQNYTPTPNIHLLGAQESISGTVYTGLGGTVLAGVTVDVVVDGNTAIPATTTDANGFYSFSFTGVPSSSHEIAAFVTTVGDEGLSLYDGAPFALSGFNIYAHTVTITTGAGTLSTALSSLAAELAALPTADQLLVTGSTLSTTAGTSLIVTETGSALNVDESVTTGGSQSYTASTLSFGAGSSNLTATAGSISFKADSLGLPAAVSDTAGVSVDTITSGATIGIGTATGSISLNQASLTLLGHDLTIGDDNSLIFSSGGTSQTPITVARSLTLIGSSVDILGFLTVTGTGSSFTASEPGAGSSFVLEANSEVTAGSIVVDPATITVNGTLNALSGGITLDTGAAGATSAVILDSAAQVTTSGSLTISTDNLSLSGTGGVPTISAQSVSLLATQAVSVGSQSGGFSAAALAAFVGIPVTITAPSVSLASGYTLPSNFTIIQSSVSTYTISGNLFDSYDGLGLAGNIRVDLRINGAAFNPIVSVVTDSSGHYSFEVTAAASSSKFDAAVYFDPNSGFSGISFYDGPTGSVVINLYQNTASLTTTASTLSAALSSLSGELSLLPTGSVTSGAVTAPAGFSLVLQSGTTAAFTIDDTVNTGSGSLTLVGAGGSIAQTQAITAAKLALDGAGVTTLTDASNAIGILADAGAAFGSVEIADAGALTLGTLNASGSISIHDKAVSIASGATIASGTGITLDTLVVGDSIGLGTATGNTLTLSSGLLSILGANAALTIGDGSNTITEAGPITVAQSLTLDGATINIDGSLTTASAMTLMTSAGGTINLNSGSAVSAAGALTIITDNLNVAVTGGQSVAPTVQSQAVSINTAAPTTPITIAGTATTGLAISAATLQTLGVATTPITVGTVNSAVTVQQSTLAAFSNLIVPAVRGPTGTVSGTAYAAYQSNSVLAQAHIDIVFDGIDFTTITDSQGLYSDVIFSSVTGHHDAVIVLTSGGSGSAFYDFTGTTLTGLNVYGGTLFVSIDGTAVATAVGNLATQLSALTTGASLDGVPTFASSGITTNTANSLIVDVVSGTTSLTLPNITTAGSLTVVDDAGITLNGVTASALTLSTAGVTVLNPGTRYNTGSGNELYGGSVGAVVLSNSAPAKLNRTGTYQLVTLPSGVGGSPTGAITLSNAALAGLGTDTEVIFGDGSRPVTAIGSITVPGGIVINGGATLGASTVIDLAAPGADLVFNGALNLLSDASISTAGEIVFEGAVAGAGLNLTLNSGPSGDIYFAQDAGDSTHRLGTITISEAHNVTIAHVAGPLDTGAYGPVISQSTTEDPFTGLSSTVNAGLYVHRFETGGSAIYNSASQLVSVDGGIVGTLSVGLFSLESDGDVAIFATAIDGRIVAGNNGASGTGTATPGTLTVAAVDVNDASFQATRSANINVVNLSNYAISSDGVANVNVSGSVSNGKITAPIVNYIGPPEPPGPGPGPEPGPIIIATFTGSATLTESAKYHPHDVDADELDSGDKKKAEKAAKAAAEKAAQARKTQGAKTYDAANQFLNKLLSAKKPAMPPI